MKRNPKMPDLTLAQGAAALLLALGVLVALLVDENTVALAAAAFSSAWVLSDAIIRYGRSQMAKEIVSDEDLGLE